jgi:hypothetical protein
MAVYLDQRIQAFSQLGLLLAPLAQSKSWPGFECGLSEEEYQTLERLIEISHHSNGWFTPENVRKSFAAWHTTLTKENLSKWLEAYSVPTQNDSPRKIGIICAGNIPMVGFHDVLSVLITGHHALIKLSSSDNQLIPALLKVLTKFDPEFENWYSIVPDRMIGQEAVIATGSNNTARYFDYYFRDIPHIIRKSRTSIAILDGSENSDQLKALGSDIFDYFGLGCRNISKVYLPQGFQLNRLFEAIYDHHPIVNHHKYANNYDYNKAVWLLNQDDLLDNGFILLKEEKSIASPTASLYYEYYQDKDALRSSLNEIKDELQCIVSSEDLPFGTTQCPMLWDYADGIDTIKFLLSL